MKKLACLLALAGSVATAQAAPINLDLTSGVFSITNGATFLYDTYVEDGFRIRMVRAGDHFDPGFVGDIGFHNGPLNEDNISWTLDFFGASFMLTDIDIAGFTNGATSVTLTGSNGAIQTIAAAGISAIAGMGNITSVTFNIDQDGDIQALGLNGINVETTPDDPQAVPLPSTLGLLGLGLAALGLSRRRRA